MTKRDVCSWLCFFGSSWFVFASFAIAEGREVMQQNNPYGVAIQEPGLALLVDMRTSGLKQHLNSIISMLDQTCELTPRQKKKLQVAVKGATEDLRGMMGTDEEEPLTQVDRFVLFRTTQGVRGRSAAELDAAISPIWQAAVENILTPQQRATYGKLIQPGGEFRRRACAANSVAKIEKHLMLSADQRKTFEDQVFRYLDKHKQDDLPGIVNIAMVVAPAAKKSLTEPQLTRLREIQAGHVTSDTANETKEKVN